MCYQKAVRETKTNLPKMQSGPRKTKGKWFGTRHIRKHFGHVHEIMLVLLKIGTEKT